MAVWTRTQTGIRLQVRVQPRSARTRVAGEHAGALKLQVNAPPVEGAANQAVVELLAGWLEVPRRSVHIRRGESSRDKLIEIESEDVEGLAGRLRARLEGLGGGREAG